MPAGVDPATGEVTDARAAEDGARPPRRATINDDIAPDELTPAMARELLDTAADDGRVLGTDPATGPRDRRQGRPLRPLRHRGAARGRRAPRPRARQGRGEGQAAHGIPVQGHGPRDARPRHGAAAALAAARRRRRPGVRRGDHRAERPLRAVPEEGHRLALDRDRAAAVRHHPRAGAGDLRPAQAARAGGRQAAAGRARRPTPCRAGRSSSRTAASGPTSPTARPTRRCARTTTPRRSRPSAATSCSPTSGRAVRRRRRPRRPAKKAPAKKAAAKKAATKKAATKKA